MKKLILIALVSLISSCKEQAVTEPEVKPFPHKPFLVIDKQQPRFLEWEYTLIDSYGNRFIISESQDKYSLGDSIK